MSRTGATRDTRPIPGAIAAAMKRAGMTLADLHRATRISVADLKDMVAAHPDEVHGVDYRRRVAAALRVAEDDLWVVSRPPAPVSQAAPPAPRDYFLVDGDVDGEGWSPPPRRPARQQRAVETQAIDADEMIAMRSAQSEPT